MDQRNDQRNGRFCKTEDRADVKAAEKRRRCDLFGTVAARTQHSGRNDDLERLYDEKQVQVWTVKENYRLGADIQSQLLAFVFSMVAQVERTLISQRTKEALNRLKSEGKHLGRATGSRNKKHVLDGKEDKILRDLSNGLSVIQTARKHGVGKSSIYRFLSQSDVR